jgi:hypothetical protein
LKKSQDCYGTSGRASYCGVYGGVLLQLYGVQQRRLLRRRGHQATAYFDCSAILGPAASLGGSPDSEI